MRIQVVNGPNLNMLGRREAAHYGTCTLDDIESLVRREAAASGMSIDVTFMQSNSEAELIETIQRAADTADGLIVNAGAFTHTSIAVRDALIAAGKPFVEVHLSNIFGREPFRAHSYLSDIAIGVVCGFRETGYVLALRGLAERLSAGGEVRPGC